MAVRPDNESLLPPIFLAKSVAVSEKNQTMNKAQKAEITDLLELITGSFPLPQNTKPAAVARAYMMAIDGFDFEEIVPVLKNIIAGKQIGFEGRWAPTSAQIGDWVLARSNAMKPSAISQDGFDLVTYPIGGKPPPGYMALGEWNDRRNQLAIDARKKSKAVPTPNLKADRK